jgi:actin-related protein 5
MTELLFEGYGVPKISFGMDALFSYYANQNEKLINHALILTLGNYATYTLPIVDGMVDSRYIKR